jgi:hypothetical protein
VHEPHEERARGAADAIAQVREAALHVAGGSVGHVVLDVHAVGLELLDHHEQVVLALARLGCALLGTRRLARLEVVECGPRSNAGAGSSEQQHYAGERNTKRASDRHRGPPAKSLPADRSRCAASSYRSKSDNQPPCASL